MYKWVNVRMGERGETNVWMEQMMVEKYFWDLLFWCMWAARVGIEMEGLFMNGNEGNHTCSYVARSV